MHPSVEQALLDTARHLEALGHHVEEVRPEMGLSWDAFVELNGRFWSSNTAAWIDAIAAATGRAIDDAHLEPATLALYRQGKKMPAVDLLGAMADRNTVARHMGHFFQTYDVLLSPTLPQLPPVIGRYDEGWEDLDGKGWMHHVFERSPFTALANVTGAPAMSVPLAQDSNTGLPIGLHFMGAPGNEGLLLSLANQLEHAHRWAQRRPSVWAGRLGTG